MTTRFGPSFQRFLHNSAAQTFGQAVNALAQIFSVPAFLHFWTKTEWGEWLVITSIPSLLWTLDSGLSGLAGNRMTVASGSGDWARANVIFHNVLFVQGLLSLAILLLSGWYLETGNVSATFGFTLMGRQEAGEVLFIMIIYMLFGYGLGLLRAAFRSSMLEARGVSLFNFNRLSEFVVQMAILACHGHAIALATGMLANMCFWCVAGFIDARIRCPQIRFAVWPISGTQMKSMLVDGVPVFAGTAAGAFFLQGYPLIVNSTLGPVAVVTLTTIRTGSRTLLQMVGIVSNASTSELSRTYGSKDWEGYLRLLKVLAAMTLWTSLAAAVGLALAGPWVIHLWTSGRVLVSHDIMLLFGLSIACQCAWSACGTILFSVNMHHAFNYAYLALTVVGLAVATYAVHLLGFAGIPTVMMIVDAALLGLAIYLCHTKLEFIPLSSLAKVVYPSFYLEKAQGVLRHLKGRRPSGVAL
jgi:O-antigen/teichoic acid export membrane protein